MQTIYKKKHRKHVGETNKYLSLFMYVFICMNEPTNKQIK